MTKPLLRYGYCTTALLVGLLAGDAHAAELVKVDKLDLYVPIYHNV